MVVISLTQVESYAVVSALLTHPVKDINTLFIYNRIVKKIIPEIKTINKKKSLKALYNVFIRINKLDDKPYKIKESVN